MMNADITALRALNFLRRTHLPTYVALRMLFGSTAESRTSAVIHDVISQASIRRSARIVELRRFKAFSESGAVYRRYFVPSPTGALADVYALDALHRSGVLAREKEVFSYRPPISDDYGQSFEHFSFGYQQRNEAVSRALTDTDDVALVLDVSNFYPSVRGDVALDMLLARCAAAENISHRDLRVIEAAAKRAISDEGGLLVGLEMSHALASVYLSPLDEEMRECFPGAYFRYVDDIVVTGSVVGVRDAANRIDDLLGKRGLRRNPDKDAVVPLSEWEGHRVSSPSSGTQGFDCLSALNFRIKLFLARHPGARESLQSALGERDIYLPIEQLADGARSIHWRNRVLSLFKGGWEVILRYRFDHLGDIINAAVACRETIIRTLEKTLSQPITGPSGAIGRRWRVQSARYAINRAFYFAGSEQLKTISIFTATVPELAEARSVCEALSGRFELLALTPGPAVAAATQLLVLRGGSVSADMITLSLLAGTHVAADLEAHLAVRGLHTEVVEGPAEWSEDLRGLVSFACGTPFFREQSSPGYGAELYGLGRSYSQMDRVHLARSRLSSREAIVLDALSLDSASGS